MAIFEGQNGHFLGQNTRKNTCILPSFWCKNTCIYTCIYRGRDLLRCLSLGRTGHFGPKVSWPGQPPGQLTQVEIGPLNVKRRYRAAAYMNWWHFVQGRDTKCIFSKSALFRLAFVHAFAKSAKMAFFLT